MNRFNGGCIGSTRVEKQQGRKKGGVDPSGGRTTRSRRGSKQGRKRNIVMRVIVEQ